MPQLTSRRNRPLAICLVTLAILYIFVSLTNISLPFSGPFVKNAPPKHPHAKEKVEKPQRAAGVPLEAHIMSKCPDARDCLRDLVVPVMQKVNEKVDFKLSYIGKPTSNDGVKCMHGAEECMGNMLELCAAKLYPSPINYLGFTMCMSDSYTDIPLRYLVEGCSLEHGIDFDRLNACASEDDGATAVGMLRESVRRSATVGVTKSCTVRLNEEVYCIRDGGVWKDCPNGSGVNDLIMAVEKLYRDQ